MVSMKEDIVTPSLSIINRSNQTVLQAKIERQRSFLRILSLVVFCFLALTTPLAISYLVGDVTINNLAFLGVNITGFIVATTSFWCSRQLATVRLGSWLIGSFFSMQMSLAILMGPANIPLSALVFLAMLISLFLLPNWATIVIALVGQVCTAINILGHSTDATAFQTLLVWIITISLCTFIGIVLARRLEKASLLSEQQALQLAQLLEELQDQQHLGKEISQRILAVTAQLNGGAARQATGSQQQASAIAEISEALQELTQTANQIATKSTNINQLNGLVLQAIDELYNTTQAVDQIGKQGMSAVNTTLKTNEQVNLFYTQLVDVLSEMKERSGAIKQVMTLMRAISDETHLLSLNAAIEAAGAGEYGQRFSIVAQEVKALSERSVIATRNVENILREVEIQVQRATVAVDGGQSSSEQAVREAQESGRAIEQLAQAINNNASQISQVIEALRNMNLLTQEIQLNTNQQASSSQQALMQLQQVGEVAYQSTDSSNEVVSIAYNLETLSRELTTTLAMVG